MALDYSTIAPPSNAPANLPPPKAAPVQGGSLNWDTIAPSTAAQPAKPNPGQAIQKAFSDPNFTRDMERKTTGKVDQAIGRAIGSGTGKTMDAFSYIEGGLQRFTLGATFGDGKNPTENSDFWNRAASGWHAMLSHSAGGYDKLVDSGLKQMYGKEFAALKADPHRYAAAYAMFTIGTDPVTYIGGGGVFRWGLEHLGQGASTAAKMLPAIRAISEDKNAPAMARWAAEHVAGSLDEIMNPSHIATGPDGHKEVVIHSTHGWFHPYARQDFLFSQEDGTASAAKSAGTRAEGSGYHKATGIHSAQAGMEAQLSEFQHRIVDPHAGAIAAAKSVDDIPKDVRALWLAEEHWMSNATGAQANAAAAAKKLGIDLPNTPAYKEFERLHKLYDTHGLVNYNHFENYMPNWVNMGRHIANNIPGEAMKRMSKTYGVAFEQGKERLNEAGDVRFPDNPLDAVRARVALNARVASLRWGQRAVNQEIGIGGKYGKYSYKWNPKKVEASLHGNLLQMWKLGGKSRAEVTNMLKEYMRDPHRHLFAEVDANIARIEDNKFIGPLAKAMASSMAKGITNNSIPHQINTARLTYLAGGPMTVVKGIARSMLHQVPAATEKAAATKGGMNYTFNYLPNEAQSWMDVTGWMSHLPGLKQWNNVNHGMLKHVYNGLASSLWDTFAKKYPHKSEWEIAHMTQEAIGGYMASPAWAKYLRTVGGIFPLWHLRTGAATTLKSMANPQRAATLMHLDDALDKSNPPWKKDQGSKAHPFGGSAFEYTREVDSVMQFIAHGDPKYITSPSAIGLIPSTMEHYGASTKGPTTTAEELVTEQALASSGLIGVPIEEKMNIYGSKQPWLQRTIQSYLGIYPEYQNVFWDRVAWHRSVFGTSAYKAIREAIQDAKVIQGSR